MVKPQLVPADVDGRTLRDVGAGALAAAALTASWGALSVAGLQPVDLLLAVAGTCFLYDTIATMAAPRATRWIWVGALTLLTVVGIHLLVSTSTSYLTGRVDVSDISSVGQHGPPNSAVQGLQWLVALAVVPVLIITAGERREKYLKWIAVAWAAGIAASAAVAVSDFAGVTVIGQNLLGFVNITGRQSGLATHPVNLGVACGIAAPVAVFVLARRRLVGTGLVGLLGAGALLSGSRGAQAAFVLAVAFTLALVARSRRSAPRLFVLAGGALAAVVFLAPDVVSGFLRFRSSAADAGESDRGRQLLAEQALLDFQERPFVGIGLGYVTAAHSIYLQVLAAGGLLLAVGIAAYFASAVRAAWRLRGDPNPLGGFLLVSLMTWLAVGVVENQLTDRYLYFPIGCIAALQLLRSAGETGEMPPAPNVRRRGRQSAGARRTRPRTLRSSSVRRP